MQRLLRRLKASPYYEKYRNVALYYGFHCLNYDEVARRDAFVASVNRELDRDYAISGISPNAPFGRDVGSALDDLVRFAEISRPEFELTSELGSPKGEPYFDGHDSLDALLLQAITDDTRTIDAKGVTFHELDPKGASYTSWDTWDWKRIDALGIGFDFSVHYKASKAEEYCPRLRQAAKHDLYGSGGVGQPAHASPPSPTH
jgi:hypothetical protein